MWQFLQMTTGKIAVLSILFAITALPTSQCFSPAPIRVFIKCPVANTPMASSSSLHNLSPTFLSMTKRCSPQKSYYRSSSSLNAVTEDDVIAAVEKAEQLWADALDARKKANKLSEEAESDATSASASADDAMEALNVKSGGTFGMSNVETAKGALDAALDAGSKVDQAVAATEEADRLEKLAEDALAASEAALEQHLIDFPEQNED